MGMHGSRARTRPGARLVAAQVQVFLGALTGDCMAARPGARRRSCWRSGGCSRARRSRPRPCARMPARWGPTCYLMSSRCAASTGSWNPPSPRCNGFTKAWMRQIARHVKPGPCSLEAVHALHRGMDMSLIGCHVNPKYAVPGVCAPCFLLWYCGDHRCAHAWRHWAACAARCPRTMLTQLRAPPSGRAASLRSSATPPRGWAQHAHVCPATCVRS